MCMIKIRISVTSHALDPLPSVTNCHTFSYIKRKYYFVLQSPIYVNLDTEDFRVLYCIALYLYIYIALLAVHTNQKRFQCERSREKRVAYIVLQVTYDVLYSTLYLEYVLLTTPGRLTEFGRGNDMEKGMPLTTYHFVITIVRTLQLSAVLQRPMQLPPTLFLWR